MSILSKLEKASIEQRTPFNGQFELTTACNLNCRICYVHKVEEKHHQNTLLPASFWVDIARQAVDAGMLVLSITGGETLLYPELDSLLSELSRMGILISFNTNGTLIDERQTARLSNFSLAKINLTLYGASDETYHKLTGCADGFTRISRAIDLLLAAGQNVYLNGVLTPENVNDLPEMMAFAASRGLILHEASYLVPPIDRHCGYNRNDCRLTPEAAAEAAIRYRRYSFGEDLYKISAALSAHRNHILAKRSHPIPRVGRCHSGVNEFAVTWKGELQPCILFPAIQEDLKKKPFIEAWNSCKRRMDNISYPSKCSVCQHQDTCPACIAAIYLETGTHDQAPEYLCRFSKEALRLWEEDGKNISINDCTIDVPQDDYGFRNC